MRSDLIAGLLACGWKQTPSTSSTAKYLTFTREGDQNLFVGKSAALRKGRVPSASISISHTKTRQAYIDVGRVAKQLTTEQQAREFYQLARSA